MIRSSFCLAIASLISLISVPVYAADGSTSDRAPARIETRRIKPIQLNYEQSASLRQALFNGIVAKYAIAKNPEAFDRLFGTSFQTVDRAALKAYFSNVKRWPRLRIEDGALVASLDLAKLRFEWPDLSHTTFRVNKINWVYNPQKAIYPQLLTLNEKLRIEKVATRLDWFIPEANAIPALAPSVLLLTVGAMMGSDVLKNFSAATLSMVRDTFCTAVDNANSVGVLTACIDWKQQQLDKELANMPALDSLILDESQKKEGSILAKWESEEQSCPTNNDKKDRFFITKIRAIEFKDGEKVNVRASGAFSLLRAVIGADGKPKTMVVGPEDLDLEKAQSDPAIKNRIWLQVNFENEKGRMTGIEIPNPAYRVEQDKIKNADAIKGAGGLINASKEIVKQLESPTLTVAPGMLLTPAQKDRMTRAMDLVNWTNKKIVQCTVRTIEKKIQMGIDPSQPEEIAPPVKKPPAPATM